MELNFGPNLEWICTRSRIAPIMNSGARNNFKVWCVCPTSLISRTSVRIHFGTRVQIDKHSHIYLRCDALTSLSCICLCKRRMRYNKLKCFTVFLTLNDYSVLIWLSTVQSHMPWNTCTVIPRLTTYLKNNSTYYHRTGTERELGLGP